MAIGDEFPTELINTTDLVIERFVHSDDWSDEVGPPTVIGSAISAIATPARRLERDETVSEQVELIADIILNPATAPSDIQEKDVARWTDFEGTHEGEIRRIQPYSGVPGLESIVLRIGRRA